MPDATARRPVRLKSPFTRAVVPVLGGIAFFVLLALVTWGIAAWISGGGADVTDRLAPSRFEVGSVQNAAQIVEQDGPIIFPGLNTTTGERTLVLDHEGSDPTRGWRIFYAYPIGRPDCPVEQVIGTREFIDCDGTTITVADLSPPESGVFPVVENQRALFIDLAGVTSTTAPS
ncbi:MAG TPA: hypothetical protein VMY16_04110 [Ilumatobacteraceae bacterium]|nr:hypothetical protein [Ilumatobacteraceae bacterium]